MDALEKMISRIRTERQETILKMPGKISQGSECPECHGTGWVYWRDAEGIEYGRRCECGLVERQIMERKLSFANLPEAFADMELNTFCLDVYRKEDSRKTIRQACSAVKYYLDNLNDMRSAGMGLYLYSDTKGSGKTRMAASIANELIKKYRMQVKFAGSVQIVNEIKASWSSRDENESSLLSALASVDVLVIDDFGAEVPKDWIGERFYAIVNGRYQDKQPTIFTSNSNLEDLRYDERIVNRIKERTYQIPFPEESIRDVIAAENRKALISGIQKMRR